PSPGGLRPAVGPGEPPDAQRRADGLPLPGRPGRPVQFAAPRHPRGLPHGSLDLPPVPVRLPRGAHLGPTAHPIVPVRVDRPPPSASPPEPYPTRPGAMQAVATPGRGVPHVPM